MADKKNEKGIALIQVLLLTAILAVLVLYISTTSRQQVKLAIYAEIKAEAYVALHNERNKIIYSLLTENDLVQAANSELQSGDSYDDKNLFGRRFQAGSFISGWIQDQSGLLSIHFIDRVAIHKLLASSGVNEDRAKSIVESLLDWQDIDNVSDGFNSENETLGEFIRNGYIPDITDLEHIPGLALDELNVLKQSITTYNVGYFNPALSPDALLRLILSEQDYARFTLLREQKNADVNDLSLASGIVQTTEVFFVPSKLVEIKLEYSKDAVQLRKSWVIKVEPYAVFSPPINFLEIRG